MFIFDCDGTITGEEYLPYVVGFTLNQLLGQHYNQQRFHDVFNANVGGGFDKYLAKYKEASAQAGEDISAIPQEEAFLALTVANYVNMLEAYRKGQDGIPFSIREGMIEGMLEAQKSGRPIWINTNARSEIIRANMAAAGIYVKGETIPFGIVPKILIDGVTCLNDYKRVAAERGVDFKFIRKPSGESYKIACEMASESISKQLGYQVTIRPEYSIGVEDSANGHQALLNAGILVRVHVGNDSIAQPFTFAANGKQYSTDLVVSKGGMSAEAMRDIIAYCAEKMLKTGKGVNFISPREDLLVQPVFQ